MNVPGTAGGSSCKRQENGDSTMESERPLKKARFAWQVKGKYHLRNEVAETTKSTSVVSNACDKAGSSSCKESDSSGLVGNTEQNLEILSDYLLKQDFNTLDSVITDNNKPILPSPALSPEKISYPRYIGSYESNSSALCNNNNESTSVSMSMVVQHHYNEDQCIAKWQARQIARGFVDNTINSVLDYWMVAPLPSDIDNNRFLALDVAEFINNLPGDNSIENEGILMAISAHGLQNAPISENASRSVKHNSSFLSPPSSPLPSDEDVVNEEIADYKPSNPEMGSSSEFDMSWSYSDDIERRDNNDLTFFPNTSNSSYQCFSDTNHLETSNNEDETKENLHLNDNVIHNHYDFLDAAVSFAIQSKGLTSFGSDYS